MFDLQDYLARRRALVEERLEQWLPRADDRPAILAQAMRHAVLAGGKRLRAIITLAACDAAGGDHTKALAPAVAIELLHCYTLVHDDLPCMDNDTMRRGQPTVWSKFGEANAVLAGDALQALAFEVLGRAAPPDYDLAGRLCLELAAAAGAGGVIGGQVEDLAFAGKADREMLFFIHQRKTAALFAAAARMGALTASAGKAVVGALGEYGLHLGLAFQIIDDLLDAAGDHPLRPGEFSILHLASRQEARQMAAATTAKACASLEQIPLPAAHAPLRELAQHMLKRLS